MPAGDHLVNLETSPSFPFSPSHLNQSTAEATNRREPSPAAEPDHGMVRFGGRLARTTWALTAVWLGDGHWGRCRTRIQRLLRPTRGRTFLDPSVGENVGGRTRLRPRGGKDQG